MKSLNKLLLLFSLFPLLALGQSNYQPGYVVNLNGDTIKGLIDYREWNINPKNIHFKTSQDNTAANYSTDNATAFAVTGKEYFERFIVRVSQGQVEMNKLSTTQDTSFLIDTVFLRREATGKYLSFFSYSDEIKTRYYLLETSENLPVELTYNVYYSPGESSFVQYNKKYLNQLESLALKYGVSSTAFENKILSTAYNASDLIKIVNHINGASAQQATVQSLWGVQWFGGVGVNCSSFKLTKLSILYGKAPFSNYVTSVFPKMGGGADFFPNATTKKLFIRGELVLSVNHYNVTVSDNSISPAFTLNSNQYNSSIIPQIGYNIYSAENLNVFMSAGVALNVSFYNNSRYLMIFGGPLQDVVPKDNLELSKFWNSYLFSAGAAINNKMEINIGFSPSSFLTGDSVFIQGRVTSYQAGVNYFFR